MYLLYDLILLASAFVLIPYYLLRGVRYGKVRRGIRERLGFYSAERLAPLHGKEVFWIHAVSVGETRAAIPLVKALRAAYPESALIISNVTETGHAIASGIKEADLCLFFPFDHSWVVRRVLKQVRPSVVLIVETEIWPNFVRLAHASKIPVVLVNGRISDRSFPRYRRLGFILKPVLEKISAYCMQSELDAERIRILGAPDELVEVTRNLKFDIKAEIPDDESVSSLKENFLLPEDTFIWVAGSTHGGEEEAVVEVYRELLEEKKRVFLILVPRHPERCRAVGDMLSAQGISFTLRSELKARGCSFQSGEVLLVDTLGEMLKFYAVSDLVFVGGSFVPIGGHNVLEASLLKKPVIFGPYMHNFKEISRLLLEAEGGFQVENSEELKAVVRTLWEDSELRLATGEGGNSLLRKNAGATAHTLKVVRRVVGH